MNNFSPARIGAVLIGVVAVLLLAFSTTNHGAMGSNANGRSGEMDAYYDGKLFTINFMELPPEAEKQTLANNKSLNTIYMSDGGLPGGAMFVSVLNAIQRDGFNPLWQEVQITFNAGFTPHQFTSDTDVEAAAAGANPEITLSPTTEVYRCSVIGPKK